MAKAKKRSKLPRPREERPATLLGIPLTALLVGGGCVLFVALVVCLFAFTGLGSIFKSAPDIRAVDAYTAVNAMGYAKVGERLLSSKTTNHKIPGPSNLLVLRDNPAGKHLVAKVRIPSDDVDAFFKGGVGLATLSNSNIILQCGGEKLEPLLLIEEGDAEGFQLSFSPPAKTDGHVSRKDPELADYLGPGKDTHDSWTCDGATRASSGGMVFDGKDGMEVTVEAGAERQDGKKGRAALGDLVGGDGKAFEDKGLVGSPSGYVRVTWNAGSKGIMAGYLVDQPNDLARSWEVTCIFQRPKGGDKEATLLVLGKARKIKLP